MYIKPDWLFYYQCSDLIKGECGKPVLGPGSQQNKAIVGHHFILYSASKQAAKKQILENPNISNMTSPLLRFLVFGTTRAVPVCT